ncbi:MAG: FmdB family zinc ribbon protein [Gemmatirosa sp.]
MPTYEFRCAAGHLFEQFHRMSDAPSTAECPTCGAVGERAISGGAGLVFKGSGFYLTDYGKNAHRTSGPVKAGEGKGESGGGPSGGSGESKGGDGGSSSGSSSTGSSSSGSSGGSSSGGSSSGTSSSGGPSTGSSASKTAE